MSCFIHILPQSKSGLRYLTDEAQVFEKNAWDHVPPPEDQDEKISAAIARQKKVPVPDDKKSESYVISVSRQLISAIVKYNTRPSLYWDIFYRNNSGNFFKDRNWLLREFPQLDDVSKVNVRALLLFSTMSAYIQT